MSDETLLREQQLRGEEARRLQDNAFLKEALAGLKAECVRNWVNTPIDGGDRREDAWRMHKAIEALESKIVSAVRTGEFARKQIVQSKEEKETT